MIDVWAFTWALGIFFAILGWQRGWIKELLSTATILLGMFAIFRFDTILRTLLFAFSPLQLFLVQAAFFFAIVIIVYQAQDIGRFKTRKDDDRQAGFLGALVGAFNGYLIGGALWYFLDINEYPFDQFITAPGPASPAANNVHLIPLVIAGGGASGSGDVLEIGVLLLLYFILLSV